MKKLAIITARGGSKRIPRKNIKDFLGKPIIHYSIEAAIGSSLFDEVMVSTDDDEIALISEQAGAKVPFKRSEANSNDYAGTVEVLLEVVHEYEKHEKEYASACCIYPTAPFVTDQKLRESFQLFEDHQFDALFPVVQFSSPIQRALKVDEENRVSMFQPEHRQTRSQDLEPAYHDAGQFYWFRPDKLKIDKELWTSNAGVIVYPALEVQDIDDMTDWKLAELKYELLHAKA